MIALLDISYIFEALFAALRISVWFVLLFGFIAPLFLKHTRNLPGIEKLIYSWLGLGGVIIITVFVLTVFHIYDFISFILILLLIPLVMNIWKNRNRGIIHYFEHLESKAIVSHIRFIEQFEGIRWKAFTGKFSSADQSKRLKITRGAIVVFMAITGGLLRMYPALMNAAPFSRNWFFQLNRIKNIRLQEYFSGSPDPGGMHSLVSVLSMLTQVSPEMMLHLAGALTSFFLCIIIYWTIRDVTKNEHPMAPVFGMSVYAVVPMLLLPLSLDQQIEVNSIDMALCFAIPTFTIFVRNLRSRYKSPWFYVLSGFIATGMTDLFIAFVVLLPLMFMGLISLPRRRYFRSFFKLVSYLFVISLIVITPVIIYGFVYPVNLQSFFLGQVYDTKTYSFFPALIAPLDELSFFYVKIAGLFLFLYIVETVLKKGREIRDEMIFLMVFCLTALLYTGHVQFELFWVDPDQLNAFYALIIAVMAGVLFSSILRWTGIVFSINKDILAKTGMILLPVGLACLIYLQGGIKVSRQLPSTLPNGFSEAYYKIMDDYLPYSYATVAPEIERISAKNRNYFMSYNYFLEQYGAIDSLYHQQLNVPESMRTVKTTPPASIFIFVEKPPYGYIQQGVLYEPSLVMRDMEQWLTAYKEKDDRKLKVYYEDQHTKVYQIINREGESDIKNILLHVHPDKEKQGLIR